MGLRRKFNNNEVHWRVNEAVRLQNRGKERGEENDLKRNKKKGRERDRK